MSRVRIISGELGGRWISADVGSATHPMSERARSAIFAKLASRDMLGNAEVLDAFAGTGALGMESLSRGAKFATFIEQNSRAANIIVENITTLNIQNRAKLFKTDVKHWTKFAKNAKYNIIFADPPYHNTQFSTVWSLLTYLRPNGLMILSYPREETLSLPNGVVVVDKSNYGEATIALLCFRPEQAEM